MPSTVENVGVPCRDTKVHAVIRHDGGVDGSLPEEIDDPNALIRVVNAELVRLRGQYGALTIQKFGQFPALRRVCGGGDLLDAYLMFEREMTRYRKGPSRDLAAAAISITAPADTVLDRLEHAVGAFPEAGKLKEQRSARRWSDAGFQQIAADLVHIAQVQGRLGSELLSIEITGDENRGLMFVIDQMTTKGLSATAPLVRVWHYDEAGEPTEAQAQVDLQEVPATQAVNGAYEMRRHHLYVDFPDMRSLIRPGRLFGVSIEGRDAPMRTLHVAPWSLGTDGLLLEVSIYRTIAILDVTVANDVKQGRRL